MWEGSGSFPLPPAENDNPLLIIWLVVIFCAQIATLKYVWQRPTLCTLAPALRVQSEIAQARAEGLTYAAWLRLQDYVSEEEDTSSDSGEYVTPGASPGHSWVGPNSSGSASPPLVEDGPTPLPSREVTPQDTMDRALFMSEETIDGPPVPVTQTQLPTVGAHGLQTTPPSHPKANKAWDSLSITSREGALGGGVPSLVSEHSILSGAASPVAGSMATPVRMPPPLAPLGAGTGGGLQGGATPAQTSGIPLHRNTSAPEQLYSQGQAVVPRPAAQGLRIMAGGQGGPHEASHNIHRGRETAGADHGMIRAASDASGLSIPVQGGPLQAPPPNAEQGPHGTRADDDGNSARRRRRSRAHSTASISSVTSHRAHTGMSKGGMFPGFGGALANPLGTPLATPGSVVSGRSSNKGRSGRRRSPDPGHGGARGLRSTHIGGKSIRRLKSHSRGQLPEGVGLAALEQGQRSNPMYSRQTSAERPIGGWHGNGSPAARAARAHSEVGQGGVADAGGASCSRAASHLDGSSGLQVERLMPAGGGWGDSTAAGSVGLSQGGSVQPSSPPLRAHGRIQLESTPIADDELHPVVSGTISDISDNLGGDFKVGSNGQQVRSSSDTVRSSAIHHSAGMHSSSGLGIDNRSRGVGLPSTAASDGTPPSHPNPARAAVTKPSGAETGEARQPTHSTGASEVHQRSTDSAVLTGEGAGRRGVPSVSSQGSASPLDAAADNAAFEEDMDKEADTLAHAYVEGDEGTQPRCRVSCAVIAERSSRQVSRCGGANLKQWRNWVTISTYIMEPVQFIGIVIVGSSALLDAVADSAGSSRAADVLRNFVQVGQVLMTPAERFSASVAVCLVYMYLCGLFIALELQPEHPIGPLLFQFMSGALYVTVTSSLLGLLFTVTDSALHVLVAEALVFYTATSVFVSIYRGDMVGEPGGVKTTPLFLGLERVLKGALAMLAVALSESALLQACLLFLVFLLYTILAAVMLPCTAPALNAFRLGSAGLGLYGSAARVLGNTTGMEADDVFVILWAGWACIAVVTVAVILGMPGLTAPTTASFSRGVLCPRRASKPLPPVLRPAAISSTPTDTAAATTNSVLKTHAGQHHVVVPMPGGTPAPQPQPQSQQARQAGLPGQEHKRDEEEGPGSGRVKPENTYDRMLSAGLKTTSVEEA